MSPHLNINHEKINYARGRICKRLWSPGINFEESILPAYVAWRAGTTNRVVEPARDAGNRFLGSSKGLQTRAQISFLLQWGYFRTYILTSWIYNSPLPPPPPPFLRILHRAHNQAGLHFIEAYFQHVFSLKRSAIFYELHTRRRHILGMLFSYRKLS
jgi:hypothetical protein